MLVHGTKGPVTSYDHRASHGVRCPADGCKVHIHRIDNTLKVERDFHVENLDV